MRRVMQSLAVSSLVLLSGTAWAQRTLTNNDGAELRPIAWNGAGFYLVGLDADADMFQNATPLYSGAWKDSDSCKNANQSFLYDQAHANLTGACMYVDSDPDK